MQNCRGILESETAAGQESRRIGVVEPVIPEIGIQTVQETGKIDLPGADALVAQKAVRVGGDFLGLIVNEIDVERIADGQCNERVTRDELITRGMPLLRVVQNADPFRITNHAGAEAIGFAKIVHHYRHNFVRVKHTVAIQIKIKAELAGRVCSLVGADKNRRAGQDEQIIQHRLLVLLRQGRAIRLHVTYVGDGVRRKLPIVGRGDKIGGYDQAEVEAVRLRERQRHDLRVGLLQGGVRGIFGGRLLRQRGHLFVAAPAHHQEGDGHERDHRQEDQRDDQRDACL